MRTSSGLMHSHSLRLAKMDTHSSLQTKLRQQLQQRMSSNIWSSPDKLCMHVWQRKREGREHQSPIQNMRWQQL